MKTENFIELIIKYLNNSINASELEALNASLDDPQYDEILKEYIESNYISDLGYKSFNTEAAKKEIIASIRKEKSKETQVKIIPWYKRKPFKYAAAASVVLLISLTFVFNTKNTPTVTPVVVNNNIKIGTDKAVLTLGDGTDVVLEKGQDFSDDHISSNGEEIIYNSKATTKPEIAYNYLTIPRGGQFFIKLADGTQVWLNSESQLKYPERFVEGELRQVELIYGEAYFEVSPSTKHKGSKFKIRTNVQEIEVLGTEFNIKAYQDEPIIYTTLVEGSVSVKNDEKSEILKPREQSVLDIRSNAIAVREVNIENEIGWIHGEFIFYKKSLKEIMTVLSRWYDVTIIFQDKSLENIEFNGELGRSQKIEDILNLIKRTKIINTYEINNKTIILK